MSVSEDRTVQPSPTTPAPVSGIADPGPLGLAAFALTTFLLSAKNAGWMTHATGNAWLGFALAYGGLAQLLRRHVGVPQQERRRRDRLRHLRRLLDRPRLLDSARREPGSRGHQACHGGGDGHGASTTTSAGSCSGSPSSPRTRLILITQTNTALFVTFFLLWVTLIVLCIGNFNAGAALLAPQATIKIGGYLGVITALVAWYTSAAGMAAGMGGKLRFPVGPALIK